MKRRAILTILLSLTLIVAATSCRSRKKTDPPKPLPPVVETTPEVAPPPATTVEPPERDFPATEPDPNVLSSDLIEANRQARERGFLRDAFFQFDASTLDDDAQSALRATADWLRSNPQYTIRVEGHCDERGTEQYNLALGDRRAEAAVAYLATLGVDRGRIQTVSYGEERPFETGSTEEAWAQNRRAHIVLTGRR